MPSQSLMTLLGALLGVFFGAAAKHGLTLTPDQQATVTMWASTVLAAVAHWLGGFLHGKSLITGAATTSDPIIAPAAPKPGVTITTVKMLLVLVMLAPLIGGCASLGLATPKGFDQQLAEAYGTLTAVIAATATAVSTGAINSAEATQVQTQASTVRGMLDAAKAVETTNPAAASNDLALALTGLTALQSYLNAQAPVGAH